MTVFAGETLVEGTCPLLVAASGDTTDKAPVVFLPGALHLARIAYGLPQDRDEDFLAHWITSAGHPFIAVSYPVAVGDAVFSSIDPTLRLEQMTDAVAAAVANTIEGAGWSTTVVVAAWSALGNTAPRLRVALETRGIELGTFVALAATPPLPNLILGSADTAAATVGDPEHYTEQGLLRHSSLRSESFFAELDRIDNDLGRVVVDRDDFRQHHFGDMALELFPGLESIRSSGGATVDHHEALAISHGGHWADYPLCGSIWPTLQSDRRHTLTDRHNWAMVNANALQWRVLAGLDTLDGPTWAAVVERSHHLATALHRSVHGGHFFFVGEPGAAATAEAILSIDDQRAELEAELLAYVPGPP